MVCRSLEHAYYCGSTLSRCCQLMVDASPNKIDTAVLCANFQNDLTTDMDAKEERDCARFEFRMSFGRISLIATDPACVKASGDANFAIWDGATSRSWRTAAISADATNDIWADPTPQNYIHGDEDFSCGHFPFLSSGFAATKRRSDIRIHDNVMTWKVFALWPSCVENQVVTGVSTTLK